MALIKAVLTHANTEIQLCNTYILNKTCRLFWKIVENVYIWQAADISLADCWNFAGYLSHYTIVI